uniref:Uncharacterized protein n=1 Tax=viral metagenome TaxID=1070528 RepID=A0A6M3M4B2_9ZZZZ
MPTTTNLIGETKNRATGFAGWSFMGWLKGNYKTIKELVKVLTPLALGWAATSNPVYTGVITLVSKFVLDMVDYYFPQV